MKAGNGERGPGGISLGRALNIPPGFVQDDLRDIVSAIDRVHGDGDLPAIPFSFAPDVIDPMGRPVDGLFTAERNPKGEYVPRSIRVRAHAPHRHFVALHEIGHFLDAAALPGIGYSSEHHRTLAPWRRAIRRSRAVGNLVRLASAVDSEVAGRARALLEPTELWARSYAQFVTMRSDSRVLHQSLTAFRQHYGSGVYLPRQWDEDDFMMIDDAIEDLFQQIGWISR